MSFRCQGEPTAHKLKAYDYCSFFPPTPAVGAYESQLCVGMLKQMLLVAKAQPTQLVFRQIYYLF